MSSENFERCFLFVDLSLERCPPYDATITRGIQWYHADAMISLWVQRYPRGCNDTTLGAIISLWVQ